MKASNVQHELRFLVTQNCNYACSFCHKEGLQSHKREELDALDYQFVFREGERHFALHSTTLTGGEPLMRKDILDIVLALSSQSSSITVTTNGFLLSEHMEIGRHIDKLNISLHTLNEDRYESIVCRHDVFEKTIENIYRFKEMFPTVDICLNSTLFNGINKVEDECLEFITFARNLGVSVKFVELYPPSSKNFVPLKDMEKLLRQQGFKPSASKNVRKTCFSDGTIEVGLTKIFCALASDRASAEKYCNQYNDLFVSPDGRIKPCRHSSYEVDLLPEIRARDQEGLVRKLQTAFDCLGKFCQHTAAKPCIVQ